MRGTSSRQRFTNLCAEQDTLIERMKKVGRKAEEEGRDLRPDEQTRYDALDGELRGLTTELRALQAELFSDGPAKSLHQAGTARPGEEPRYGAREVNERTAVLTPGQSVRDWAAKHA